MVLRHSEQTQMRLMDQLLAAQHVMEVRKKLVSHLLWRSDQRREGWKEEDRRIVDDVCDKTQGVSGTLDHPGR